MTKAPSGFVPLSMNYLRDPRIRRAGPDAELLFVRSLAYAKASQMDGTIPDYDLSVIGVGLKNLKPRVDALVREGLWEAAPDGWAIRSWAKWNMTQEEIAHDKDRKRRSAIRTNHERWHTQEKPDANCSLCQGDQ